MKLQASLFAALAACSIATAVGQTPTPTPTATPNATEVFAKASDGTCLQWDVFLPDDLTVQRPVVLVIHIGGFKGGHRYEPGAAKVATSLRNAGFIACSIDYRLDWNLLDVPENPACFSGCQEQTKLAYAPNLSPPADEVQITDVRKAIDVAHNPPTCSVLHGLVNGYVGAVGGSAGGSHALACAAKSTTSANRPDAVVCMSGIYKFDDPEFLANTKNQTNVYMYCQTTSDDDPNLDNGSPGNAVQNDCAPVYAFGSAGDSITPKQLVLLHNKFAALFGNDDPDHQTQEVEGSGHAFGNWYKTISDEDPRLVYILAQDWLAERLNLP